MKPTEEKAVKLVMDSRVTVQWSTPDGLAGKGTVDGDHDTYQVSFSPAGRVCTCPAGVNYRDCSHGIALELEVKRQMEQIAV